MLCIRQIKHFWIFWSITLLLYHLFKIGRWFPSLITGQNVQKLQILLFFALYIARILNHKWHRLCLSTISSAIYWPFTSEFDRKVGDWYEIDRFHSDWAGYGQYGNPIDSGLVDIKRISAPDYSLPKYRLTPDCTQANPPFNCHHMTLCFYQSWAPLIFSINH